MMKEQIYQDVKNALQQLADALGIASEHLWAILVRQQITEAIFGLLWLSLAVVFGIYFTRALNMLFKGNQEEDKHITAVVIFGIFFAGFAIAFFAHSHDIFTGFINPEYGAFQEIKEILK